MMKKRGAHSRRYPTVRIPGIYGISGAVSLESIQASIERVTGKPIVIEQGKHDSSDSCLGTLVRHPTFDLIIHAPTLSQLHLQQLVLHEFAHIMQSDTGLDAELAGRISLDCESVYEEQIEFHAEALADHMAAMIRRSTPSPALGHARIPLYGKVTHWRSLFWS